MIQLPRKLQIRNIEYRILNILGQGAYGRVYLAENNSINYAIKEQDCFAQNELDFYQKILSKQNKPFRNVINILAIEQIGRHTYIVMEQAESSLYEQITNKTFPKKNIRYVMKEIANGIKELHDNELTHRDIKPENILIKTIKQDNLEQQVYKICDFGTIKHSKNLVTQKLGTPYYISPEQLNQQPQQYSNKVDIWAFGAMCYELLTGNILFNGMTTEEIENKILNDDVKMKIQSLKDVEGDYKNLLILMLERDPNKRCDINQVIKQLEPRPRSVSRHSTNQQIPSNPSIRSNNYFIQSEQTKKRSVSGLDSEIENNTIKIVSKSPMQFQPNYRPPLHLQQDQKYNIKPSWTMQTNSQINYQNSTIQSQKRCNPVIFGKKLEI